MMKIRPNDPMSKPKTETQENASKIIKFVLLVLLLFWGIYTFSSPREYRIELKIPQSDTR
jgi:hypothetical protein